MDESVRSWRAGRARARAVRFLAGLAAALGAAVSVRGAGAAGESPAAGGSAAGSLVRLHLVWTNDIHGHVAPEGATFMNPNFPPPLGGGASAAAYVEKLRDVLAGQRGDAGFLLLDAGDTWSGAPVSKLSQGAVMEDYFNILDYDVVIPGNHEFDKGQEVAVRISKNMKHRFVCANLFQAGTQQLVDWVEPYRIVERAGLRIGIVGAITPGTKNMAFKENIAGIDFGDILPAVEEYRDILYKEEHVDVVFAVVHEGLPFDADQAWHELLEREKAGEDIRKDVRGAMDLAHVLEGVPVIVGGHTHRGYRKPWIDPVTQAMVLETFGNGSSLGHVVLKFDRRTKTLLGWDAPMRDGVLVTLFEDEWWPEEKMARRLQPFIETARRGLDVKVGSSRIELTRRGEGNSPMGNFVTDAMREEVTADFAFTNTGGLRVDLPAGDVTVGDLLRLSPFDNTLAVVQMDGRTIRRILERKSRRGGSGIALSGAAVVVDPDAPEGQRVRELRIGDDSIQVDRMYRVVTTDYLMEGNSGLDFLAEIPPDRVEYTQIVDRDALSHYLERHSPIAPRIDERWRERPGAPQAKYLEGWALP